MELAAAFNGSDPETEVSPIVWADITGVNVYGHSDTVGVIVD